MIKKKGIYLEKQPFGNCYAIIYYDGFHLLVIPINASREPYLYIKYSGTTFTEYNTHQLTTMSRVITRECPFGVNYVCDNPCDFPLIDINNILKGVIDRDNKKLNIIGGKIDE